MHPVLLLAIVVVVVLVLLGAQYLIKQQDEKKSTAENEKNAPDVSDRDTVLSANVTKRGLENEILDIERRLHDLERNKAKLDAELADVEQAQNVLAAKRIALTNRRREVSADRVTRDKTLSDKFERIDNLLNQLVQSKLDSQTHLSETQRDLVAQTKLFETDPNSPSIDIVGTKAKIQALIADIQKREEQYAIIESDRIALMHEIVRMQKSASADALEISRELCKIFSMEARAHSDRSGVLEKLSKISAIEADIAGEKRRIETQITELIAQEISITQRMTLDDTAAATPQRLNEEDPYDKTTSLSASESSTNTLTNDVEITQQ